MIEWAGPITRASLLFKNLLVGGLPERIARRAKVTVVTVKRRSGALKSWVRQTLLDPTVPKPLD